MSSLQNNYIDILNSIDFTKIKDHPNILIAANFWDSDRYDAASTCYRFMRDVDDMIDNHKAIYKNISESEKRQFRDYVDNWLRMVFNNSNSSPFQKKLIDTIKSFRIPVWALEAFAKSMIYDIHNDGFPTFQTFIEYAGGASVAPAAIFVHLCGIKKQNGRYSEPAFDVRKAATSCAIFSYLVHIIRDFQKDQLSNLNYFADDMILKNGLNRKDLRKIAEGGYVSNGFRNLVMEYYKAANEYRKKTYKVIDEIRPFLEPEYLLSLRIIFGLYLMVFERIDISKGHFTAEELNPTPEETKNRVHEIIINFSKGTD
jgi:phytoene/squalene synthetase